MEYPPHSGDPAESRAAAPSDKRLLGGSAPCCPAVCGLRAAGRAGSWHCNCISLGGNHRALR